MQLPRIWLYVYAPLKAERGGCAVEVYVEVCLVLCNLDRVTDIQGWKRVLEHQQHFCRLTVS